LGMRNTKGRFYTTIVTRKSSKADLNSKGFWGAILKNLYFTRTKSKKKITGGKTKSVVYYR